MAEAFLRAELATRDVPVAVASAGFVTEGARPPPEVVRVMGEAGIDVSAHRSRRIGAELVRDAAVLVTMTRQHLAELTTGYPAAWGRSFTFAEALDRGERIGPRRPGEQVEEWAGRVHGGRARSSGLEPGAGGDVADPMGGSLRDYERARGTLAGLAARLAVLLDPARPD
jgi:protein-tyrosine phosphatase